MNEEVLHAEVLVLVAALAVTAPRFVQQI